MKRVSYAGVSFLTTDGVADALLRFVAALGLRHNAETVEIPAVGDRGDMVPVQLVIGPASELVSMPETSDMDEPDTSAVITSLNRRTDALSRPRAVAYEEQPWGQRQFYDEDGLESM
jgi:hypothetical protein